MQESTMAEHTEIQSVSHLSQQSQENTPMENTDGSSSNNSTPVMDSDEEGKETKGKKILNAIKGWFNGPNLRIISGKTLHDVPNKKINKLELDVVHAYEAPDDALSFIHERRRKQGRKPFSVPEADKTPVAGIYNWKGRDLACYGIVTSLYEREKDSARNIGDPVADCLAIVGRSNNCILALADGVNWGERSMTAARSAVYGAVTDLIKGGNLDQAQTTKDVFRAILRAFEFAQEVIMDEEATLTTLCVAVVIELLDKDKWGLCVVNLGDSLAFVYSQIGGVREVTVSSHSLDELRDMRYSGGALGPADGFNPDLGNLTLSYTQLENDDIVYLTSDGISDNFDPVIGRFRAFRKFSKQSPQIPRKLAEGVERKRSGSDQTSREYSLSQEDDQSLRELSLLTAKERHKGMLFRMRHVIETGEDPTGNENTAIGVCAKFMNFAASNTNDRRCFLESEGKTDAELLSLSTTERKERAIYIKSKLNTMPGKLDHASIVAFQVGRLREKHLCMGTSPIDSYHKIDKEELVGWSANSTDEQHNLNSLDVPNEVNHGTVNEYHNSGVIRNLINEVAL